MSGKDGFLWPYQYDYELAKMAGAIYKDERTIEESMKKTNPDDRLLPDDWRIFGKFEDTNAKTGFVAGTFWNPDTKQIVIAYRGSEPREPDSHGLIDYKGANAAIAADGDMRGLTDNLALRAAGQLLARQQLPDWHAQFQQGLDYAERILKESQTLPGGPYTVHVTGHSLGGAVAQVTHEMFDLPGRTFDPGGAANLTYSDEFKAWRSQYYLHRDDGLRRADRDPEGRDFSNYLVNDSLVSRYSGSHVGKVEDVTGYGGRETFGDKASYHVKRLLDGPVGAIGGGFNVVDLHDMDRIIRVFKEAQQTGELNRVGVLAPEPAMPAQLASAVTGPAMPTPGSARLHEAREPVQPDVSPPIPAHLRDFRHQDHPLHGQYEQVLTAVQAMEDRTKVAHGPHSERLAAALTEQLSLQRLEPRPDWPFKRFQQLGEVALRDNAIVAIEHDERFVGLPSGRELRLPVEQATARSVEQVAADWSRHKLPHLHQPQAPLAEPTAPAIDPRTLPAHDWRRPDHARHGQYEDLRSRVADAYAQVGVPRTEAQLEQATAAVAVSMQRQQLTQADFVRLQPDAQGVVGPGSAIGVYQHDPAVHHRTAQAPAEAMQQAPDVSFQLVQQAAMQQAIEHQQREAQRAQQQPHSLGPGGAPFA